MVEIKNSDIGGEIISILTRGMYADPKDTIREYVQNGVDADANNINIKIRKNTIVIEDDGFGMNSAIMRKAIRLGISEKNPRINVGFMGIGLYSSFHLCDKLDIFSKVKNQNPNQLTFDFKKMREILERQKEARINNNIDENKLIALQELMEHNISLNELSNDDYANIGTRVEMIGVQPDFFTTLSKFDEVSSYLEQTIPLPFDPKFKWGNLIEDKINEICKKHDAIFKKININLQINEDTSSLYRPYTDDIFDPAPLEPYFHEMKEGSDFFGVAWGCLNSSRSTIKNKVRGFIIKKQGFSIGTRENLMKYFKATLFNRYVGEFIVVHPHLLPNAPRNDFEFSPLRTSFINCLGVTASLLNDEANKFQEYDKSAEELNEIIDYIKEMKAQLNYFEDNGDKLLDILFYIRKKGKESKDRIERGSVRKEMIDNFNQIIQQLEKLDKEIVNIIDQKKRKKKESLIKSEARLVKEIEEIPQKTEVTIEREYKSLNDVLISLGIEINQELKTIIQIIDEQYIQSSSNSNQDYYIALKKLKQTIEKTLED